MEHFGTIQRNSEVSVTHDHANRRACAYTWTASRHFACVWACVALCDQLDLMVRSHETTTAL